MRLRHRDGSTVHLGYCTNVHAAEDVAGIIHQLATYAEPVRMRLGTDRLGVGLWLARDVADALAADSAAVSGLRRELQARGLEVVTLNGFPYRGFGQPVVKHAVYAPDWAEPARLGYTVELARLLAALLPDDAARGSISTLPLAWRSPWKPAQAAAARAHLDDLAGALAEVERDTGRRIRVGFEPEPGCVVETTEQAARELAGVDTDRLGVCLDACHLAVGFEDPPAALSRLAAAGLPVVKLQASTALHADDPAAPATRAALERFVEPRYLHQTRERAPAGVVGSDDLDAALRGPDALPAHDSWRVHFHIPLHAAPETPLHSTSEVLLSTLHALYAGPSALTDHVEVETYTWHVLPAGQRPQGDAGLLDGIAAEIRWARDALLQAGLAEIR